MSMQTVQFYRAQCLVECSAVTILKIFVLLCLNVCFIHEVRWYDGSYIQAEEAMCASFLPCHPVCIWSSWCVINTGFWWIYKGSIRELQWWQGKHITSIADLVDCSEKLSSPFKPELASDAKKKKGNGILKNTSDKRTLSYLFLLVCVTSPYYHLHWKWWQRRKGKGKATHGFLSFWSFHTQIGRMCAYQEGKYKQLSWFCAAFTLFWWTQNAYACIN